MVVVIAGLALSGIAISAVELANINVREIGRSDPRRAAHYSWVNFDETYTDGIVLGVAINSTKIEAIQTAEKAGFEVEPGRWGDGRAGGASLYDRPTLLAFMLRQNALSFSMSSGVSEGMEIRFTADKVVAIRVYYVNFEGP